MQYFQSYLILLLQELGKYKKIETRFSRQMKHFRYTSMNTNFCHN